MYLLAVLVVLASCDQETSLSIAPDITSFTFGPEGGEFTSVIFTNGIWAATCDDPSVTFTPESGDYTLPMHISVGKNEEHYTKSIRISITSENNGTGRNGRIVITQDCFPFLDCDNTQQTVPAAGGKVRFSVNSNEAWKLVSTAVEGAPAQFSVSPDHGAKNRIEVVFDIPANESGSGRVFSATLALEADASQSVVLTVRQDA